MEKAKAGYDRRLLAHKVNWEGGVLEALAYGIRSALIADADLARKWAEVENLYERLAPKIAELERELEAAA